jgi:hypothetical protein
MKGSPGDLLEEFSQLASKSGIAFARSWYWRQTLKSLVHLAGAGFRNTPWSTFAIVMGGDFDLRQEVQNLKGALDPSDAKPDE